MAEIPHPPLFPVESVEMDYSTILQRARMGPEEPYPTYEFGGGRKTFWSTFQGENIYDKPVDITGETTIHLPDPDLISTNP